MYLRAIPCDPGKPAGESPSALAYSVERRTPVEAHLRGGDIFDAFDRGDGTASVLLADLSSKGPLGTAQAQMLRDAFRRTARRERSPANIMSALNRLPLAACAEAHSDTFATVFIATIGRSTQALCYASAGHDTALIVGGRSHRHLAPTGPVIGVIQNAEFADGFAAFGANDLLLIATDGFTECRSSSDRSALFGTTGIVRALGAEPAHSHRSACGLVALRTDAFTGGHYRDDATLAAIARR
jgi:serine phosphatase RsbU (regulator of sigma subunit)